MSEMTGLKNGAQDFYIGAINSAVKSAAMRLKRGESPIEIRQYLEKAIPACIETANECFTDYVVKGIVHKFPRQKKPIMLVEVMPWDKTDKPMKCDRCKRTYESWELELVKMEGGIEVVMCEQCLAEYKADSGRVIK